MKKYYLRLDDACEKRDIKKWDRIEQLLDKYGIKPIVGVIPHCEDPMMDKYEVDTAFWSRVDDWISKGWIIALHGYNHVYSTACGGINPVNKRSEFAGEPLEVQREKIKAGVSIFRQHEIEPTIFFAPSHTFDENTLTALKEESRIKVISDTIAWDTYKKGDFVFIPQQSGMVRKLPFRTVTYCYHPNTMKENEYMDLESFIVNYKELFSTVSIDTKRAYKLFDKALNYIYMRKHK